MCTFHVVYDPVYCPPLLLHGAVLLANGSYSNLSDQSIESDLNLLKQFNNYNSSYWVENVIELSIKV